MIVCFFYFGVKKRLLRNRVSAQQARERKKAYLSDLETRVKDLEKKNSELEERLSTLQNENQMLRHVCTSSSNHISYHFISSASIWHIGITLLTLLLLGRALWVFYIGFAIDCRTYVKNIFNIIFDDIFIHFFKK